MTDEEQDFIYFRDKQLHSIDLMFGSIDAKNLTGARIFVNVGSINDDGYERIWCNGTLRMKHRFIYYYYHGILPKSGYEIDHTDNNRGNNSILNLTMVTKSVNNTNCTNRKFGKQLTIDDVIKVCELLQNTDMSDKDIAEFIGRSRATIRDIKTRRTRKSISKNYTWKHRNY